MQCCYRRPLEQSALNNNPKQQQHAYKSLIMMISSTNRFSFRHCHRDGLPLRHNLSCSKTGCYHARFSSRDIASKPIDMAHRKQRLMPCRSLLDDSASFLPVGGALLLLGGVGYLVYLYSQIEYITAAMIARHVPPQASVIQIGGGTKELFYYPKTIEKVTVVGENVNKGLMEQGGIQAGCPTICKSTSPADMRFAPTNSIDALICIRAFGQLGSLTGEGFLLEAARVLKPGGKIVFIEQVSSGIISGLSTKEKMFEQVAYDQFLEKVYPHVAGIAIKNKDWVQPSAGASPRATRGGVNKGF